MKVWWVMETELPKEEERVKKYQEYLKIWTSLWHKKHEGVKYVRRGSWTDNPGYCMGVAEYESMEEFSKVYSDQELHEALVILRKHMKSVKTRVMRPCVQIS